MSTQPANSNNSSPSRPEEQKENEELNAKEAVEAKESEELNAEVLPTEEAAEAKESEELNAEVLPTEEAAEAKESEEFNAEVLPTEEAAEAKENEELNAEVLQTEAAAAAAAEAVAERRGVKRRHRGKEQERNKVPRRNNTETLKQNTAAWLEMFEELSRIDPKQYSSLLLEELAAHVTEDAAEAERKKEERFPPPGADPTDEIWKVPDGILPEIAAWKKNAGLPEKYGGVHFCEGRSVDDHHVAKWPREVDSAGKGVKRPEVGCDFVRFGGNIYACKATGVVHVCDGQPCSRASLARNGDLVCTISAGLFHWGIVDSPPRSVLREERRWEERRWAENKVVVERGNSNRDEEETESEDSNTYRSLSSEPKDEEEEEEGSSGEEEEEDTF